MTDTLRLVIFIIGAIGAIINLYLEFKKTKKVYYRLFFYRYSSLGLQD
ncbi:hypothetical protein [Bacillus thuringiensis]